MGPRSIDGDSDIVGIAQTGYQDIPERGVMDLNGTGRCCFQFCSGALNNAVSDRLDYWSDVAWDTWQGFARHTRLDP